ncbi:DUF2274 domain-containing protein [Rudaea sp.]|uniref:DUF2274 domain-containing protein n=1 Tax=Rudaea sp. TaxID=2136325 RepID=UPI003783365B
MSSRFRPLPNIPVKHVAVRKVINLTPPLESKLHAYIRYYAAQQGLDAKQVPSESDTIVALIESFLDRDVAFNRYMRTQTQVSRPSHSDREN